MKIAVVGAGNLGLAAAKAVMRTKDMSLEAVLTHRNPGDLKSRIDLPFYAFTLAPAVLTRCDVALICTSSERDTPLVTPFAAQYTNVVDCYDNHDRFRAHFLAVQATCLESETVACVGAGWDPGLFSLFRLLSDGILPHGTTYTFWGPGISQGHTNALKNLLGTDDALEITEPLRDALKIAEKKYILPLSAHRTHRRICYVCKMPSEELKKRVRALPGYFEGYETVFRKIGKGEMARRKANLRHEGRLIRIGRTGDTRHSLSLRLSLESNPDFTAAVMTAYARAVDRLYRENRRGAFTPLTISPQYLAEKRDFLQYI